MSNQVLLSWSFHRKNKALFSLKKIMDVKESESEYQKLKLEAFKVSFFVTGSFSTNFLFYKKLQHENTYLSNNLHTPKWKKRCAKNWLTFSSEKDCVYKLFYLKQIDGKILSEIKCRISRFRNIVLFWGTLILAKKNKKNNFWRKKQHRK